MKKAVLICVIALIVLLAGWLIGYAVVTAPNDNGTFLMDEYVQEINNSSFHTDKVYDKVTDYKSAAKVGKKAIADRFEDSEGSLIKWMDCDVSYDQTNDAWFVRTYHINDVAEGGDFSVLLKSDGTVVSIWGGE